MKWATTQQSGFTLVEMLVVLSLLALAAAVSLPYARASLEERKFDGNVREIAVYLRDAQARALANGKDVVVTYEVKSRRFTSTGQLKSIVIADDVSLSLLSIDQNVKPEGAGYVFFATGGNSGGRIALRQGPTRRSITLNWLTGTISTSPESSAP